MNADAHGVSRGDIRLLEEEVWGYAVQILEDNDVKIGVEGVYVYDRQYT